MRRLCTLLGFVLAPALLAGPAFAAEGEDHPLVSRYEGSAVDSRAFEEFGQYLLATGYSDAGGITGEKLRGKLTRLVYRNPEGRSTLEIYTNYRQALAAAGMEALWGCELEQCGPAYARSAWGRYNGLFAAADGDPRYLAAKLATAGGTAYVGLMVGKRRTQLDVVEIVAMEENLVVADAAALGQGIDRDGRVSVYGIYFDTDRTDIEPESKPALEEIAKLLKERPALALYVVGHTDMTGGLAHNRTLSEGRARAVVAALVTGHGIAAARLEGHGVGPLAPAATNANESGRAQNRRVELVAR